LVSEKQRKLNLGLSVSTLHYSPRRQRKTGSKGPSSRVPWEPKKSNKKVCKLNIERTFGLGREEKKKKPAGEQNWESGFGWGNHWTKTF